MAKIALEEASHETHWFRLSADQQRKLNYSTNKICRVEYWTNQERKETQLLSGPKASVVIGRVSSYCQGSKADRTLTNTDWVTTDQPQEAQHKKSWKPRR